MGLFAIVEGLRQTARTIDCVGSDARLKGVPIPSTQRLCPPAPGGGSQAHRGLVRRSGLAPKGPPSDSCDTRHAQKAEHEPEED